MNIIRQAMKVLATRGLAKWTALDETTGQVCAGGALSIALTGQPWEAWGGRSDFDKSMELIGEVACEQFPDRMDLKTWNSRMRTQAQVINNHPETTLEDMLLVLDKASVRYDEFV